MGKIEGHVDRAPEGTSANGLLDFTNVTLGSGQRAILGSSLDYEAVTGWIRFDGNTASGFRYSAYLAPETDGTAKILGIGSFPKIASGGSSDRVQALSSVVTVEGTLESRGGDATAGAHNVWAKFSADLSSATIDAGARIAPLWSDIQVNNGDVSSEEVFGLLISAGGSDIRSLIRWEGTADSTYLLETENGAGNGFIAAQGDAESVVGNQQAANLAVDIAGTTYYIPLMSAA